jgi:hypothetical protein
VLYLHAQKVHIELFGAGQVFNVEHDVIDADDFER